MLWFKQFLVPGLKFDKPVLFCYFPLSLIMIKTMWKCKQKWNCFEKTSINTGHWLLHIILSDVIFTVHFNTGQNRPKTNSLETWSNHLYLTLILSIVRYEVHKDMAHQKCLLGWHSLLFSLKFFLLYTFSGSMALLGSNWFIIKQTWPYLCCEKLGWVFERSKRYKLNCHLTSFWFWNSM